jgi:hypothetical protein
MVKGKLPLCFFHLELLRIDQIGYCAERLSHLGILSLRCVEFGRSRGFLLTSLLSFVASVFDRFLATGWEGRPDAR